MNTTSRIKPLCFVVLMALTSCTSTPPPTLGDGQQGQGDPHYFTVYMYWFDTTGGHLASGFLEAPNKVVTAAHNLETLGRRGNKNPYLWVGNGAILGSTMKRINSATKWLGVLTGDREKEERLSEILEDWEPAFNERRASAFWIHPQYPSAMFDVGVVLLSGKALTESHAILGSPPQMPSSSDESFCNYSVWGFGRGQYANSTRQCLRQSGFLGSAEHSRVVNELGFGLPGGENVEGFDGLLQFIDGDSAIQTGTPPWWGFPPYPCAGDSGAPIMDDSTSEVVGIWTRRTFGIDDCDSDALPWIGSAGVPTGSSVRDFIANPGQCNDKIFPDWAEFDQGCLPSCGMLARMNGFDPDTAEYQRGIFCDRPEWKSNKPFWSEPVLLKTDGTGSETWDCDACYFFPPGSEPY